jgi:TraM recognition site of TraD and TraG
MAMRRGDLDTPLLQLSPYDDFTLRDACQGVCIMGGIGSGKTSGSGKALASAYLTSGMGGLILCAKPEEADLWRQYCNDNGRAGSLLVFDGIKHGFNFIAYELARQGSEGLNSVVECLMRVLEIARSVSPTQTRGGDTFWEDTTKQILRNTLPILYAATGTVRIADLLAFVRSAPRSQAEMTDPVWQRGSFFCEMFTAAAERLDDDTGSRAVAYWRNDFATLDAKTRGNIVISLTTALDRFNHGWLKSAFCEESTILPELCFEGAIILLDMPALTRNEDGIIAQQLFKYMWQRAVLARNGLAERYRLRPVFLWADEAQYFINSFDAEFLSTCRGSRCCTVFLSQSLPTYYAKMGGENARDRVHHLLGNFATRIWHNNACHETNEWASKTIGRSLQNRRNFSEGEGSNSNSGMNMGDGTNWGHSSQSGGSITRGANGQNSYGVSWGSGSSSGGSDNRGRNRGHGTSTNTSHGMSEQMDYIIEPGAFSSILKTGGPANDNRVSAVWYQAGRSFRASGGNAMMAEFRQ